MASVAHTAVLFALLAAPAPPTAVPAPQRRFIVGTPDRLTLAGDRQHPRRHERVESAVAAYADVDEVVDSTWLRHEVEGYARRAANCAGRPLVPCRRASVRLDGARVIQLVTGSHAEIVWMGGRHAVRLGWRRLVSTPTGTLTLDDPPADFAAALLAEYPSDLDALAGSDGEAWADADIDRRLYYVERALDVGAASGAAPSVASLRFARAGLLAVEAAEGMPAGGDTAGEADGVAALLAARARWAAAVARRAAAHQPPFLSVDPWCAAPTLGDAPPSLARLP